MEHLIYQPSKRTFHSEIRDAAKSPLEVQDWSLKDREYGICAPAYPRIRWLSHPHEDSSYLNSVDPVPLPVNVVFLDRYGPDWDVESILKSEDLRCAHTLLRDLEDSEVILRITAYVQSWLYFGLLEAISERYISVSYFVRTGEDNVEWLYTRNLPAFLEAWRRRLSSLDNEARDSKLRQARDCAIYANTILADLTSKLGGDTTSTSHFELRKMLLLVEPALSVLHEAVVAYIDFQFRTEIRPFTAIDMPFPRSYSERLIQKGWCPFVVSSAEIIMPPSFLRYVDTAGYAQPTDGHRMCTADACKRNQIDPETYSQQHWQPKCRCRFMKPSLEQVFEMLDAGKIPVVQFCDQEARFELRAINPDGKESDYIAFSHVWADGLGSCTEKGLPTCQVRRLHRLSQNRATYEPWFWIDGLCVPKAKPYRGKAIQLMEATYRNATGVVVLDSNLRRVSTSSSTIEIGWTLLASGWMGRLWTYQEGFLPPWVDLELSDGFCDLYSLIQNLYKAYYKHSVSPFPFLFTRDLLASLQKTRPLGRKHYARTKSRRVVDTFNVLTRRQTSRPDDQLLVLGLLLDIDVEHLMALSGEDRWKEFYLSMREVPWTIIFDRRPKMCSANFRWAPKTWISYGKDEWLHYDDDLAVCSNNGLHVNITALILNDLCTLNPSPILIQVDEDLLELWRSPSSPVIGPAAANVIFIRHFKYETPRMCLHRNSSVLMRVGVGILSQAVADQLQYDFTAGWDIRLLEEVTEEPLQEGKLVTGQWEQREFIFT
jgi:hypothetical protein